MISISAEKVFIATTISVSMSLLTAHAASAYTYTQIFDNNGLNRFPLFSEAINDSGTVGFSTVSFSTFAETAIFTGSGSALTPVVQPTGSLPNVESFDINNNGTVLFFGERDDGSAGLFTSSGGSITTIADDSGLFSSFGPFGFPFGSTINDRGVVAFAASLDSGGQGIFTGSGSAVTAIGDTSSIFSSFVSDAFINNSGSVAFAANLSAGGEGIFTSSGNGFTTIVDSSGIFDSFGSPAINDSGTSVFTAFLDSGELGLYKSDDGVITPIVNSNESFTGFGDPAINNDGSIAFLGFLDDSREGIFTGANPVSDKVIASGDTLFGKTVTGLSFFNRGLNNSNQIAFSARFDDGSNGIFRADPTAVPEPASILGMLAVGTIGAVFSRKNNTCREIQKKK